ncbi:MAG TPA: SMP-30/gluconolactonase/LRE family protein [Acidocella sp.]|nr:MAG: hypothetical protein B7Z81_14860 [Acidocella sp. 20-61-6]HQT47408.1 SMP-30/gluconolactonase/LRE family protein [Acidocella sp.]
MTPELVLDAKAAIAESLLWVPSEAALYWVDIKAPALYRLMPETGETKSWKVGTDIGGFALDGHGRALVALRQGMHWLDLASGALTQLTPPPFVPKLIRFNESACDSSGRFWVGTMTDPPPGTESDATGMLYSYSEREGLRAHMDFAVITNGMAFSADERSFFISHSTERKIFKYAYDAASGKIGAREEFVAVSDKVPGIPDGAALDAQGYYWCALHGGGRLHRYAPDGRLDTEVELPVSQPTMCCFAGPDLADLYVSSARAKLSREQIEREPQAGGIFRLRPGVAGQPKVWRV